MSKIWRKFGVEPGVTLIICVTDLKTFADFVFIPSQSSLYSITGSRLIQALKYNYTSYFL